MRFESFYASFSPSLHPVTHRSFAYSQCHSYVLLWPALLFQLPGLFPSFFSPIGFLWCSHTSYASTLYFLLLLSVNAAYSMQNGERERSLGEANQNSSPLAVSYPIFMAQARS